MIINPQELNSARHVPSKREREKAGGNRSLEKICRLLSIIVRSNDSLTNEAFYPETYIYSIDNKSITIYFSLKIYKIFVILTY